MDRTKPKTNCDLELIRQNFPAELLAVMCWCLWRYVWREPKNEKEGKWTKVPYQPNGATAKSNDRGTGSPFGSVCAAYCTGKFDGVGCFLFPPLVGIDLDHVRDSQTGEIEQWAAEIIKQMDSYCEVSPSGTGVHIWTAGELRPDGGHRKGRVEIYQIGRYFTVTGEKI